MIAGVGFLLFFIAIVSCAWFASNTLAQVKERMDVEFKEMTRDLKELKQSTDSHADFQSRVLTDIRSLLAETSGASLHSKSDAYYSIIEERS